MSDAISIDDLKSNKSVSSGRNIDGKELRTFENGMKEFDPVANGIDMEAGKIKGSSDIDNALDAFDKVVEKRIEEAQKYNDILDQYGGAISEEDLRKELGQEHVTAALQDGTGGKNEVQPGVRAAVNEKGDAINEEVPVDIDDTKSEQEQTHKSKELADLENELEDDYDVDTIQPVQTNKVIHMNNTIEEIKFEEPVQKIKEEVTNNEEDLGESVDAAIVSAEPPHVLKQSEVVSSESNAAAGNLVIPERKDVVGDPSEELEEDKDMKALEGITEDTDDVDTDDYNKKLREELEKKMRPMARKFDLTNVTISRTPITVNNALNKFTAADRKSFTWALINTRVPITMRSFTATELEHLQEIARNNENKNVFQTIYDHVIAPRSKTFETWAKCVSYYDVDHIWFAIYCACFADSNYIPFNCSSCNQLTVANDIPISSMVKYKDDATKELHTKIRNNPADPSMTNKFAESLIQVSDTLVFGFREPSIYDAVIAPMMYDSEFTDKYQDIIGLSTYISGIYSIDYDSNQLYPIATKVFPGNEVKTMKAKIIQYSKIIRALTSDQYSFLMRHISTLINESTVTYELPSITCDHCKKEIRGRRMAAFDLVFTRHRLGILGA